MSIYEEKIKNMQAEDFKLTGVWSWESDWRIYSDETNNYSTEDLIRLALEFTKETKETVNIPFAYNLDEEGEIFVQIYFTVRGDISSVYAQWLYCEYDEDLFEGYVIISDIEYKEYNGFSFPNITQCLNSGICAICDGIDFSKI